MIALEACIVILEDIPTIDHLCWTQILGVGAATEATINSGDWGQKKVWKNRVLYTSNDAFERKEVVFLGEHLLFPKLRNNYQIFEWNFNFFC